MGAKIITEKDFWMCSSGAMPAQLQGTRTSNKKASGEVYITVADTATSSWIDFGCTKNMLLAAIIAAVAVVVVVALVVGTGGIALIGVMGMMAIGAAAGVSAGVVMAIKGALQCGQKNATQRTWSGSKDDLLPTNTQGITGAHTMTCKIGGVVAFAPEVKSWLHAVALGGLNYLTKLAECALGGAAVGAGGFLASGLAGGTIALAAPTVGSVVTNFVSGFTGIWGGSRVLFGLNGLANEQAMGKVDGGWDGVTTFGNAAVPEIGMMGRILSGHPEPTDALILLYLLNFKAGRNAPRIEEPANTGDKDGNTTPEEDGSQPKDEEVQGSKGQGDANEGQAKSGEKAAYEEGKKKAPSKPTPAEVSKLELERLKAEAQAKADQATSLEELKAIAEQLAKDIASSESIFRNSKPGNVSYYESGNAVPGKAGGRYTGTSYKPAKQGVVRPDADPAIKNKYDRINPNKRSLGHGNCGELEVHSKARRDGNLGGGRTGGFQVEHNQMPIPQEACKSCKYQLEKERIVDDVTGERPRPSKGKKRK